MKKLIAFGEFVNFDGDRSCLLVIMFKIQFWHLVNRAKKFRNRCGAGSDEIVFVWTGFPVNIVHLEFYVLFLFKNEIYHESFGKFRV